MHDPTKPFKLLSGKLCWRAAPKEDSVEFRLRMCGGVGLVDSSQFSIDFQSQRIEILLGEMIFAGNQREIAVPAAVGTKRDVDVERPWLAQLSTFSSAVCVAGFARIRGFWQDLRSRSLATSATEILPHVAR